MRREILDVADPGWCCPGHDNFPCETYKNNRSKRARSRDKGREHRHVRRVKRQLLIKELDEATNRKIQLPD